MRFNKRQLFTIAMMTAMALAAINVRSQELGGVKAPAGMPEQWQYSTVYSQTLPTDDQWWRQFGDPMLDSLIAEGVANNYDVAMAARRIEMARQSLAQARSGYYPTLGLDAGWTRSRSSGMTVSPGGPASTVSYFDLGVNMQWQIDVFGKVTAQARSAQAGVQVSKADYDAMMVSVSAKIATAYLQLRTLQAELALVNEHIASQDHVTTITKARHEAGLASELDVQQSLMTYYSTIATSTSIETQIASTVNALAVLLGEYPDALRERLSQPADMPDYHQLVAVGVPMELLRRRPDIAQAEYTLAQYAAQLGVAKKDFLPTLTLTGQIGTSSHDIGDMFGKRSLGYTIAPSLSWTIFDGMSRRAAVASAKEQMLAGIDNYNLTVLNAVQEVETAMTTYANDIQYIDMLDNAVKAAHQSFTLSIDLYKQGLTAFINVSDAQIALLQYSNQLVVAKGQALTDLVNLYQALGGGF